LMISHKQKAREPCVNSLRSLRWSMFAFQFYFSKEHKRSNELKPCWEYEQSHLTVSRFSRSDIGSQNSQQHAI
jgi:hypothetical protein